MTKDGNANGLLSTLKPSKERKPIQDRLKSIQLIVCSIFQIQLL